MKKNLFFCLLLICFKLTGQDYVNVLNTLNENFAPEKIHIHFDKDYYLNNETIYFKIYIVKNVNEPAYSKTIYIDFYDGKYNLMQHFLIPIVENSSVGSFTLPQDYSFSEILVKAYSERMLALDSQFLFIKKINIINPNSDKNKEYKKSEPEKIRIDFFPEGGNYIINKESIVAFKIRNQKGRPINHNFILYDKNGSIIDTLKPIHDGMGEFIYKPNSFSSKDFVLIHTPYQNDSFFMPQALSAGADLSLYNDFAQCIVSVQYTPDLIKRYEKLKLLVTQNYQLCYSADLSLNNKNKIEFSIDKTEYDLPNGILTFTLCTPDFVPLEERIIFNLNENFEFTPNVFFKSLNLSPSCKNEWDIIIDEDVFTNLSMSVTDAEIGYDSMHSTILTNFLFEQDLKGKIVNPNYYFNENNIPRFYYLDLVMKTHGWRKYDLFKMIHYFDSLKLPSFNDNYITISGKVLGQQNTKSKKVNLLNLIVQNNKQNSQWYFLTVDSNNTFSIDNESVFDTCKIFYFFNTKDINIINEQNKIALDKKNITKNDLPLNDEKHLKKINDNDSINPIQLFYINRLRDYYKKLKIENLSEVVVTKQKTRIQQLDEQYASGLFTGSFSRNFDVENDPYADFAPDLFYYIQSKVAGLIVQTDEYGERYFEWRGNKTLFYQNEVPVEPAFLLGLRVNSIAYIKVFPPPFFGAFQGGQGGAICIYTKNGFDKNRKQNTIPNSNFITVIGYSTFKEFYNPSFEDLNNSFYQDQRTTLFWEPKIQTDKKNRLFKVNFFNNKSATKFRIIIEGIDNNGRFAHWEKLITN